jgi:hypothetical protein
VRATLRLAALAAFVLYAASSVLIFGRGVVTAPNHRVIGDLGADKTIFMWAFVWWPHAIAHLQDPFHTTAVWAPHGIDLAWITAVPGASILAPPLTFTAGPVVAYNVFMLAAPAFAAWTAFLLCRALTGRFWPSLLGGWIFGFSAFVVNQTDGHLHMTLVFGVPLAALLVVKRLRGELSRRRFVVALTLVLTFQFLFSTEIFFTLCLVALLFAALAWWRLVELRAALQATVREVAYAAVGTLVLLSPYLVHAFLVAGAPKRAIQSPTEFGADVLNLVVPTRRIWLRPSFAASVQEHFRGNGVEQTAYLGVPLLALVLLFLWQSRKRRADSVLALGAVVVFVLACGPYVRAYGRVIALGPWWLLAKLPVTESALPVRMTLYVALAVGIMLALWLARSRSPWRWATALLAIAVAFPNPSRALWTSTVPRPSFFAENRFAAYLHPDERVLVFPYGPVGWSMLWQAEAHLRFQLVGGYLGPRTTPRERRWYALYHGFAGGPLPPHAGARFRTFLAAHRVRWVIVAPGAKPKVARLVGALGVAPVRDHDALLYRVSPG